MIADYILFSEAEITSKSAASGVADQPLSLDAIVKGAQTRATTVFEDCTYSFGIESGLMRVDGTKTGYMVICACSIYDGQDHHLGLSCAFELPASIIAAIIEKGMELRDACYYTGLTDDPNLGTSQGAIGILTNGRITRKDYTKQAVTTALIHLENSVLFRDNKLRTF